MVGGLLLTGILTAFIIPAVTSKWAFSIGFFVLGIIEGMCLVATPALIRDFSPRSAGPPPWASGPAARSWAA